VYDFCGLCPFLLAADDRTSSDLPHLSSSEPVAFSLSPFFIVIVAMADTQQAASASPMPPDITNPNYKPLPGRLGNLTVPQQHALDTLKQQLKDEQVFVEERMDDAALLKLAGSRFWFSFDSDMA
jgi:hypothetical protein